MLEIKLTGAWGRRLWCDDRVRETGSGESFLSFSSRFSGNVLENTWRKMWFHVQEQG